MFGRTLILRRQALIPDSQLGQGQSAIMSKAFLKIIGAVHNERLTNFSDEQKLDPPRERIVGNEEGTSPRIFISF
jgi:hypothetical protein